MTSPLWEVTPGTPGVRREFLDYVADIANILAHQNARSVNDPRARRNDCAALLAPVRNVAGLLRLGRALPIARGAIAGAPLRQ
jgi:hypothetical protein